jgi:hypothetical protein
MLLSVARPPPLPTPRPPISPPGQTALANLFDLGWAALFLLVALVPTLLPQA